MSDETAWSFDAYVLGLQKIYRHFPDARYETTGIEISCDDRTGYADAFVSLNVSGKPVGIRKQAILVLKFRREGDRWLWFQHKMITGNRGYLTASETALCAEPL